MRLISRWSSAVAAAALVGTSFTIAIPAMATDLPGEDKDAVATVATEEVAEEQAEVATPEEEAPATEEAVVEEAVEEAPEAASAEAPVPLNGNPTIAEVRALDDGTTVTTEGWVTAAYPIGGLNGFTIQTAGTGGACDLTGESDAIFVFTNHSKGLAPTPEVGQYVQVTGDLATYYNLRQISTAPASSAASKIKVLDSDGMAPANPITCEWPGTEAERMSIQSMLYLPTAAAGFVVTDTYDANTQGVLGLSTAGEPLQQPSDVTADSEKRTEIENFNAAHALYLDDGYTFYYTTGPTGDTADLMGATKGTLTPPYVSAAGEFAVGAEVEFREPMIIELRNDKWKLNPTKSIPTTTTEAGPLPISGTWTQPEAPGNLAGDFTVGGFNVENYFPTSLGEDWAKLPGASCTSYKDNAGNPITVDRCKAVTQDGVTVANPRGAWTQEMLDLQTNRLVTAINELDAAALGLMELENSYKMSFGDASKAGASAAYLVEALNAAAGTDKWAYITPDPANQEPIDEMDVMYPGIIYQPAKVTAVEDGQLTLNNQSAEGQAFGNARAPFGQLFVPTDGGDPFFLVANHFKSKSGSGEGDNEDTGEGGWNGDRTRQATALAEWANGPAAETLKERTGYDVDSIVLVGDFNSYTFEKPMLALYDNGFNNVNVVGGQPENTSYNYGGLNGSLDHVIVSDAALDRVTGHAIWNVNASQQIGLNYSRYNVTGGEFVQKAFDTPLRASDHDPAVVGFSAGDTLPSDEVDLTLLNINDFHGRIDGTLNDDKNALTASSTMQFAYTVDQLREEAPYDNSLFLSAGDNVGASLFASAIEKDVPTIDLLNTLGLGASAVGNHEFDAGWKDLNERLQDLFKGPLLAANVYKEGTEEPVLPASTILEAAGLKVAVIGAVTQETPTLVNPDNVAGLTFGDPVEAVNREVKKLQALPEDQRPDVIIGEFHDGAASVSDATTLEEALAESGPDGIFTRLVNDIDPAVVAMFHGHTHQQYTWAGPVPGEEGKFRPIVSTGSYGVNVGKVVLTVDTNTNDVTDFTMELVGTAKFAGDKTVEEMKQSSDIMEESYGIVLEAVQNGVEQGSVPTGKMTQTISRDYTKGDYADDLWEKSEDSLNDRNGESPMGTLVGNMLRDGQMSTLPIAPDFGVTNPGGLRTDFTYTDDNEGLITVAMARAVLPFNNNLSVATMTGAQIYTMLEQQWQRSADGSVPGRPYLQLGLSDNITYTYHEIDDPKIDGAKLGVVDSVILDGEPIDKEATYRVGTFEFLAAGGDNFWVFQDTEVQDTGLVDWESWLAYLAGVSGMEVNDGDYTFATPMEPNFARAGVMVEGTWPETLKTGDEVDVTLRNMNEHAIGAPANTSVDVTVGGVFIGSYPVTTEKMDNGNWTDWAKVQFTVPEGIEAGSTMVAVAQPTGTVVGFGETAKALEVRRLAGATRYGTNLAVNETLDIQKGAPVFVVSGSVFADSLSAAPAAKILGGSMFLTPKGSMDKSTLNEIKALEPSAVFIIGGTGAVSDRVASQLRNAVNVIPIRIGGADRYETSARVFQNFFWNQAPTTAYVATGTSFPDALTSSAAAGAMGSPVLLVNGAKGTNLASASTWLLKLLGVENVQIAGGSSAVNETIAKNLGKSFQVTRLAGANRYETNLAINNYLDGVFDGVAVEGLWVATGRNFADALSASPAAGDPTQRLVLSNGQCLMKPVVSEWIKGEDSQVSMVSLVGGKAVLSEGLMDLPECK